MCHHLAVYKRERLGVEENGVWLNNNQPYSHILPEPLYRLNIIETIRREFWAYAAQTGLAGARHQSFHHLNSSQAFAFNLLFPWLYLDPLPGFLFAALGLGGRSTRAWRFEHMPDQDERTTFDLHAEFTDDARLLVEVKLTEDQFGGCVPTDAHRARLLDIYAPRLAPMVTPGSLEEGVFFPNYQLFRNVSHLDLDRGDILVLLLPRANECTWQLAETFRQLRLADHVRPSVRLVAAEDLVATLSCACPDAFQRLRTHLEMVSEKYLLPAGSLPRLSGSSC